jgi:hypothetical protein
MQIVAEHDDVSLNRFLEDLLQMSGIAELNIDFKKMKKKVPEKPAQPDWKLLFFSEKETETKTSKHLSSNFEIITSQNI